MGKDLLDDYIEAVQQGEDFWIRKASFFQRVAARVNQVIQGIFEVRPGQVGLDEPAFFKVGIFKVPVR